MKIPALLMQTWKTHEVPLHWRNSPLSVVTHLPHWKHVVMSDADNLHFVESHFPHLKDFYVGLKYGIQRSDVIRYMWLFIHGGVYMDLDIEILAELDELFPGNPGDECLYLLKAPRNFAGHYTNFFMASSPRHPFWLRVLEECTKPINKFFSMVPHLRIQQQTGLGALSRATETISTSIHTLPFNFLVPCDYCDDSESACSKPFKYFKFLKGKSWNGIDTTLINFVVCNYDILLVCFFLCGLLGLYIQIKFLYILTK